MPISCDTDALATLARCFSCLSPVTLQEIQTYLLCQLANSGGGSGQAQTPWASDIDAANFDLNNVGTINGLKVYRALITQAGVNAPVATVLENTLGGTVVWTRDDVGSYFATLAGAFTTNKTFFIIQSPYTADSINAGLIGINWASANVMRVTTADGTTTPVDDILTVNTPVEILVYP